MIERFDHAVIAVGDLDQAMETYRALGFDVQPGGHHTGEGTHNALVRFGLDYLELMAVRDESEARRRPFGSQLLDLLRAGRGGLIGYVVAGTELDALAGRMERSGLHPAGPVAMQRQRPDGRTVQWRLLFPRGQRWRDIAPFVIEWAASYSTILSEAGDHPHRNGVVGVEGLTIGVTNIGHVRALYENAFGLQTVQFGAACARVKLGAVTIELIAPENGDQGPVELAPDSEGVVELRLAVRDLSTAVATMPGLTRGKDGIYRIPPTATLGARIAITELNSRHPDELAGR